MTEAERLALGEDRRLIFENVANGVPVEDVMAAFRRSHAEIDREVAFVAKKIKEYRFRRQEPPLQCETMHDIRWNRLPLLDTLRKFGPNYLSTELLLPKVAIQKADQPGAFREIGDRGGIKVTGL